jgi:hypothetical protein
LTTLSSNPSSSVITQETLPILEESIGQILLDAGCENVWREEMEPVQTWDEFVDYIKVHDEVDLESHEAWFISRVGFEHDPLTSGTWNSYEKTHRMSIHGVTWQQTFSESYQFMQKQAEKNGWWLERNKGGLSSAISEFRNINVTFSSQTLGDAYLYHSMMSLNVLMTERETGGRS